jgi:hypothetical protein
MSTSSKTAMMRVRTRDLVATKLVGAVGIEPLGVLQACKLFILRFAQIQNNRSNRGSGVRHRYTNCFFRWAWRFLLTGDFFCGAPSKERAEVMQDPVERRPLNNGEEETSAERNLPGATRAQLHNLLLTRARLNRRTIPRVDPAKPNRARAQTESSRTLSACPSGWTLRQKRWQSPLGARALHRKMPSSETYGGGVRLRNTSRTCSAAKGHCDLSPCRSLSPAKTEVLWEPSATSR